MLYIDDIFTNVHAQVAYNIFCNCVRIDDWRREIYVREMYFTPVIYFTHCFFLHAQKIFNGV